jgi:hypothetical protein
MLAWRGLFYVSLLIGFSKAISAHGLILALTIQVRDRSWSRFDPWVKKPASRFFAWFCNPMEYMEIINA